MDEHVWRDTRVGDKYATAIIDLTPIGDATGAARLHDMVQGHPSIPSKGWLPQRIQAWRDGVEVITMDEFSRFIERHH